MILLQLIPLRWILFYIIYTTLIIHNNHAIYGFVGSVRYLLRNTYYVSYIIRACELIRRIDGNALALRQHFGNVYLLASSTVYLPSTRLTGSTSLPPRPHFRLDLTSASTSLPPRPHFRLDLTSASTSLPPRPHFRLYSVFGTRWVITISVSYAGTTPESALDDVKGLPVRPQTGEASQYRSRTEHPLHFRCFRPLGVQQPRDVAEVSRLHLAYMMSSAMGHYLQMTRK